MLLYPTYDVHQSYHQGNIFHMALWLGQYLDIACGVLPALVVIVRHHTSSAIAPVYTPTSAEWNNHQQCTRV